MPERVDLNGSKHKIDELPPDLERKSQPKQVLFQENNENCKEEGQNSNQKSQSWVFYIFLIKKNVHCILYSPYGWDPRGLLLRNPSKKRNKMPFWSFLRNFGQKLPKMG